jgi:hypothetical protein
MRDGRWAAGKVVMRLSWRVVNANCEVWRSEEKVGPACMAVRSVRGPLA